MRPAVQYGAVELASPAALQQSIQPTGVSYPRGAWNLLDMESSGLGFQSFLTSVSKP